MDRRHLVLSLSQPGSAEYRWLESQLDLIPILDDEDVEAYIARRAKICFPGLSVPEIAVMAEPITVLEDDDVVIIGSTVSSAVPSPAVSREPSPQSTPSTALATEEAASTPSPPAPAALIATTFAPPPEISQPLAAVSSASSSSSSFSSSFSSSVVANKSESVLVDSLAAIASPSGSPAPVPAPPAPRPPLDLALLRPHLNETTNHKSPSGSATKLIALLQPSSCPAPIVDGKARIAVLNTMKTSPERYRDTWIESKGGLKILAEWLKDLVGKQADAWKATAEPLLEVMLRLPLKVNDVLDLKLGRIIVKYLERSGLSTKQRSIAKDVKTRIEDIVAARSDTNGASKKRKISPPLKDTDQPFKVAKSSTSSTTTSLSKSPSSTSKPAPKATPAPVSTVTDKSFFGAKPKPVVSKKPAIAAAKKAAPSASSTGNSGMDWLQQQLSKPAAPKLTVVVPQPTTPVEASGQVKVGGEATATITSATPGLNKFGKPKKRVVFRDSVGGELADVRLFTKGDDEGHDDGATNHSASELDNDEGAAHKLRGMTWYENIDWSEPLPFQPPVDVIEYQHEFDLSGYIGIEPTMQAARELGGFAVMYGSDADVPDSPSEEGTVIVEDGPSTRRWDQLVQPFKQPPVPHHDTSSSTNNGAGPNGAAGQDINESLSILGQLGGLLNFGALPAAPPAPAPAPPHQQPYSDPYYPTQPSYPLRSPPFGEASYASYQPPPPAQSWNGGGGGYSGSPIRSHNGSGSPHHQPGYPPSNNGYHGGPTLPSSAPPQQQEPHQYQHQRGQKRGGGPPQGGRHYKRRTPCKFWGEGRCLKGDVCDFAHGDPAGNW